MGFGGIIDPGGFVAVVWTFPTDMPQSEQASAVEMLEHSLRQNYWSILSTSTEGRQVRMSAQVPTGTQDWEAQRQASAAAGAVHSVMSVVVGTSLEPYQPSGGGSAQVQVGGGLPWLWIGGGVLLAGAAVFFLVRR